MLFEKGLSFGRPALIQAAYSRPVKSPFSLLHARQHWTIFIGWLVPPRDFGMTWSRVDELG